MRRNLLWIAVGLLLSWLVYIGSHAMGIAIYDTPVPSLTDDQRRVLIREKFVPVTVVKEIPVEVEVPGETVTVRERVEVAVPGETVEVVNTVEVPADCPSPGPVALAGECTVEIVGEGEDSMARGWWSCQATGNGWSASRDRVLADTASFKAVAPPKPPLPGLFEIRLGVHSQPGARIGLTVFRASRRMGWWVDADYGDPQAWGYFDYGQEAYVSRTEDQWRVAGGVAWRFGR